MAARSVLFTLRDHKIFSTFKESFQENAAKTQNLMDCKDDILYLWHAAESCLLTLNIKTLEVDKNLNFQRLVGTESTNLSVTTVLVNPISTWVVVSGPHEATVMRLPRRSGPKGLFQGGRDTVICKTKILDEYIYMSECEIYRVKWHPNSKTDSHLLILSSDNTVRLYDLSSDDQPLKQVWQIGRKDGRLPILSALGDTAVDIFPCFDDKAFLLTGNGNVHLMDINVDNKQMTLDEPLAMYPAADDNYGLESCSILKLGENFVCIATCGGTLYHCIILPDEQVNKSRKLSLSSWRSETSFETNSVYSLYVIEAIELDLGLNINDEDTDYTCPIHLIADEGVANRYFCYHETGVHIITVPLLNHLENYFNANEDNLNNTLPSFNTPSIVEYAICTKTSKINVVNPPLGICLSYSTHSIVVLLSNFEVVIRALDEDKFGKILFNTASVETKTDMVPHSIINSSLNEMKKVSFDAQIQHILKHDLSQPILKLAPSAEPSPQECFELLSHATHIFREDYFTKLEQARKEIEKRVKTLRLLKKLQLEEIEEWETNKTQIAIDSEQLILKHKNAQNKQEELNKRCEKVLRFIREKNSKPTLAERKMADELNEVNAKIPKYVSQLKQVQLRSNLHKTQMENLEASRKKDEITLGKHPLEIIKHTLSSHTNQIQDLNQKLTTMKSIADSIRND